MNHNNNSKLINNFTIIMKTFELPGSITKCIIIYQSLPANTIFEFRSLIVRNLKRDHVLEIFRFESSYIFLKM